MTACATEEKISEKVCGGNLILPVPDTDARMLTGLLSRAARLGRKLHLFGLKDFSEGWVPRWLEQMDKLVFQICLAAGKAKSKGKN